MIALFIIRPHCQLIVIIFIITIFAIMLRSHHLPPRDHARPSRHQASLLPPRQLCLTKIVPKIVIMILTMFNDGNHPPADQGDFLSLNNEVRFGTKDVEAGSVLQPVGGTQS